MLAHWLFLVNEAFLNLRRQRAQALTCITAVSIVLFLFGVFSLFAWHSHNIAASIPRRLEIHAFTQKETTPDELKQLAERARRVPGVAHVRIIPRDKAWQEFKRRWPRPADLDGLQKNPLPDKLEIVAARPEQTFAISAVLSKDPEIHRVNDAGQELRTMLSITEFLRIGGFFVAFVLLFSAGHLIFNVIKLALNARARDISIMRDVGATAGAIRMPFIIEGLIAGSLGGLAAGGVLGLLLHHVTARVLPAIPFINEFRVQIDLPLVVALLVTAGALFGVIGSLLSLQRHLKTV